MAAQFTIYSGERSRTDMIGMWDMTPVSFSFDTSTNVNADEMEETVGCAIVLPKNPDLARLSVQEMVLNMERTRQAISTSGQTLGMIPPHRLEETSFGVGEDTDNPETALLNHLARLRGDSVSFSSESEEQTEASSKLDSEFKTFLKQAVQFMKPTLQVETRIEEKLMASTRIRLRGDFETLWHPEGTSEHIQLHSQLLSYTLESRMAIIQLLAHAVIGAAALAAKFSIPGGSITALPAAWRYIQDMIAQTQKVRESIG